MVGVLSTLAGCGGRPSVEKQVQVAEKLPEERLDVVLNHVEVEAKNLEATDVQANAVAEKLQELNPGLELRITMENGVVTDIEFDLATISDITPVQEWAGLQRFRVVGGELPAFKVVDGRAIPVYAKGKLADLSPLKAAKLISLSCMGTQVSDLSPLMDMKLETLNCRGTQVSDLSPLKDMPLTELTCSDTQVSDLSPLMGMSLTSLDCSNTQVSDLSPLKGINLKWLDCSNTECPTFRLCRGRP